MFAMLGNWFLNSNYWYDRLRGPERWFSFFGILWLVGLIPKLIWGPVAGIFCFLFLILYRLAYTQFKHKVSAKVYGEQTRKRAVRMPRRKGPKRI